MYESEINWSPMVMDLPLPFQLTLVLVLFGQGVLHLLEPIVVHLSGIDMRAGQGRAEELSKGHRQIRGAVRILGVVKRH